MLNMKEYIRAALLRSVKISLTTEPNDVSFLEKIYLGPGMIFDCFIFIVKSLDDFRLFSTPVLPL